MQSLILIPARMASTRLPNKPLADINGLPMICQVYDRAVESNLGDVYIACAEQEIADAIIAHQGKAILTTPSLPSGTDRIAQAMHSLPNTAEIDIIINLQGDLPTLSPSLIKDVLRPFEDQAVDITTLVCAISDDTEINNPNVVKAIVNWQDNDTPTIGNAGNFSRQAAPASDGKYYHHIGIYAYRRTALAQFVALPPSEREQTEKLEQLRALDNGMRIDAVKVDTIPLGVDTAQDLEKARKLLSSTQKT